MSDIFEPLQPLDVSNDVPPDPLVPRAELDRALTDLAAAHKRVDELARAFQSLSADREDFKKRLGREREQLVDVEKGNVAVALIEALDELDLSLAASAQETGPLAKGVRLVRDNLLKKLQQSGVERLNLIGSEYDPNVAEAVDMEVTPDPTQDQLIVSEVRAAYRYKGRIIRPARVKVAKHITPAQA